MRFKLPKIQTAVNANKKLPDHDPRKYIHVYNGYAIVSNDLILVVDIKEYVKQELGIVEEDEMTKLREIVSWMNDKSFTKEFWAQLTSEVFLEELNIDTDEIQIKFSNYNQTLQYLQVSGENNHVLKLLKSNLKAEPVQMEVFAIPGDYVNMVSKALSGEIKSDNILFSLSGTGSGVKFSLSNKDYIFGVIPESFQSSMDLMAFDNVRTLQDILAANNIEDVEDEDDVNWANDEQEQF